MPICLENETEHSVHDVGCPLSRRTLAMLLCMNINALCKIRDLSWNLKSFTHTHTRIYDMVKQKINYMAILNLVRRHIPVVLIAMTVIFFGVTVYCWLVASLDRTWSKTTKSVLPFCVQNERTGLGRCVVYTRHKMRNNGPIE